MINYFLMRSSKELANENLIGYGWQKIDFSQYSTVEDVLGEINAGRRKNQIKRYFKLKEGDVVLVPTHRAIIIGIVSGQKSYDANAKKDSWNQIAVNFKKEDGSLRKISTRTNLITNRLLARMRLRMTIANLNEFSKEIESLIKTAESGNNDAESLYNDTEELKADDVKQRLLSNLKSGKDLRIKGGGDGFEELVCELLKLDGFVAEIEPKKSNKDKGDIDIIAKKEFSFGISLKLYIQAKHHRGSTSMKAVEQVDIAIQNGEVDDQSVAMVISTADFSDGAILKAENAGIILISGNQFVEWLYKNLTELSPFTLYGLGISNTPSLFKH